MHFAQKETDFRFISIIVIFTILFTYFLYHTISGKYGFVSYLNMKYELSTKTQQLNQQEKELSHYRNKVDRMQSSSLDIELLDEQARKILGYANKDEAVIY